MKIFFDQCTPAKIKKFLQEHSVRTAPQMGWGRLKDGPLLNALEKSDFNVLVTGDKSLYYQQNLKGRNLGVVALGTNNWRVLRENIKPIVTAINETKPGKFQQLLVEHTKVQPSPSQEQKAPEKAKLEFFSDVHKPKPGIKH